MIFYYIIIIKSTGFYTHVKEIYAAEYKIPLGYAQIADLAVACYNLNYDETQKITGFKIHRYEQ